jgi:hypothetical protein
MNETLNAILLIGIGFIFPCIIFGALALGWVKGAKFTYRQFEPPDIMPAPPTAEQLRESISKISCPYDIVFDALITTQFATGVYAHGWERIYGDIVNHITAFAKDLDPTIKTIVVRAIKVDRSGKPSFAFEPIITLPKN